MQKGGGTDRTNYFRGGNTSSIVSMRNVNTNTTGIKLKNVLLFEMYSSYEGIISYSLSLTAVWRKIKV